MTTGSPISELGRGGRKHSLRTARIFARHILTEYDVEGEAMIYISNDFNVRYVSMHCVFIPDHISGVEEEKVSITYFL